MTLQKTKRDVYTCTVERYAVEKRLKKTHSQAPPIFRLQTKI